METIHDTLILGGGIAGLTTALALKQKDINSAVVESAENYLPIGAGIFLAPNALEVYRKLGISDELITQGQKIDSYSILTPKGKMISSNDLRYSKTGGVSLTMHRSELQKVLLKHLTGTELIMGKESKSLSTVGNQVQVYFDDFSTMNSQKVIVAEGIHSNIRKQLFPKIKLRYAGYYCWRGVCEHEVDQTTIASETWGPNGRFGIVPIAEGKTYWYAVINGSVDNQYMLNFNKQDLLNQYSQYHKTVNEVIGKTDPKKIMLNQLFDLPKLPTYQSNGLVLVGDAAHAPTPNMGQGACQAIEDAFELANCMSKHNNFQEATKQYEEVRYKRTQWIVQESYKIGKLAQVTNPVAIALRNQMLRAMPKSITDKQLKKVYNLTV